jgi:ketosteroid isomerase-like protein
MTEQQNVALIQNALQSFARGDVPAILDACTADCEFRCPGPAAIPYAGTMRGKTEIQRYFDELIGTQTNPSLTIEEFVAQGENVVAIGRYTAEIKATGKRIESPVILTFKLKDGKIARHMVIGDTAALASAYTASSAVGI